MTKEVEKLVQELFLEGVCKHYNCGSQRCDCSDEWLQGCKLFLEFKKDINELIILKRMRDI
jgi:hypothetical protein